MTTTAVRAANALNRRWAASLDGRSVVLSAAAVWPLLGLLASAATGRAREELSTAVGIPAQWAAADAGALLADLEAMPQVRSALGLWARESLPLNEGWLGDVPEPARGVLTGDLEADQAVLDAWANDRTGGLIKRLPIQVTTSTLLVLAAALSVRTTWAVPFEDVAWRVGSGPWAGAQEVAGLTGSTPDVDRVGVAQTLVEPVTVLRVPGDGDVDVHLILGEPDRPAGDVLPAGLSALDPSDTGNAVRMVPGSALPPGEAGPGLLVSEEPSYDTTPLLSVMTPRFDVTGDHDLLERAELFGLTEAKKPERGHFPGISPVPLMVYQAAQSAVARFTAVGFEAAAVTAFAMTRAGSAPMAPPYRARRIRLDVDRPFGFAAVHRPSGLVLACGWVAEPQPFPRQPYARASAPAALRRFRAEGKA